MPLHSAMTGSEVHEEKLISTAVVLDAGKVVTPSGVTPGVGVLRKLLGTELDTGLLTTDTGKVLTPRSDTNGVGEWRYLEPEDLDRYLTTVGLKIADISVVSDQWVVAALGVTSIRIRVVLDAALTAADETVTVTVGGATAVPLVVPFSGSGAGVVTSSAETTLSAAQAAGAAIRVQVAGTSTGPAGAYISLELYS